MEISSACFSVAESPSFCVHREKRNIPLLGNATVMELWTDPRYLGLCQRTLSLGGIMPMTGKDTIAHLLIDAVEKSKVKILVLPGILFPLDGGLIHSIRVLLFKITMMERRRNERILILE
jgi:hypothetical protein